MFDPSDTIIPPYWSRLICILLVASFKERDVKRIQYRSSDSYLDIKQANIKQVILPLANKKHVDEIEKKYIRGLKFRYVEKMIEVINFSLEKK